MKRFLFVSLCAMSLVCLVAGCGAKQDIANSDTAVAQFHARLNAGNFDQIYTESDTAMKNASSQEKFVTLLEAIHRKLGSAKSADRQSFFMNYGTSGKSLRLTYSTHYDADNATEEFVFHVDGNDIRLAGYHISPEALITK
jgi:hypothetical protein